MSQNARVFVGIDLHVKVCEKLALVQGDLAPVLRPRDAHARWVPQENMHVTVKFIGEIDRSLVSRLRQALDEVGARHAAFEVDLVGVGTLPDGRHPRVVVGHVRTGVEPLTALVADVEETLVSLGVVAEHRPYRAHVTLGRIKTTRKATDLTDVVEALRDLPMGSSRVLDLVLFESHLTPKGARYDVLSRHYLSGSEAQI